jgi:hypothetical protein
MNFGKELKKGIFFLSLFCFFKEITLKVENNVTNFSNISRKLVKGVDCGSGKELSESYPYTSDLKYQVNK